MKVKERGKRTKKWKKATRAKQNLPFLSFPSFAPSTFMDPHKKTRKLLEAELNEV